MSRHFRETHGNFLDISQHFPGSRKKSGQFSRRENFGKNPPDFPKPPPEPALPSPHETFLSNPAPQKIKSRPPKIFERSEFRFKTDPLMHQKKVSPIDPILCQILFKLSKKSLKFVDFGADFYRDFTKSCRINKNSHIFAQNCEIL